MTPQTSDEHRARWPGMDTEAIQHLESRGWIPNWNRSGKLRLVGDSEDLSIEPCPENL